MEGWLTENPHTASGMVRLLSKDTKRYFTLDPRANILEWATQKGASTNKGCLPLDGATIIKSKRGAEEMLVIQRKGESLELRGEELDGWVAAIKTAIERATLSDEPVDVRLAHVEKRAEAAEKRAEAAEKRCHELEAQLRGELREREMQLATAHRQLDDHKRDVRSLEVAIKEQKAIFEQKAAEARTAAAEAAEAQKATLQQAAEAAEAQKAAAEAQHAVALASAAAPAKAQLIELQQQVAELRASLAAAAASMGPAGSSGVTLPPPQAPQAVAVGAMGQMSPPRPPSAGSFPPPPPPETPATDKGSKHRSRINGSGVTSDDDSESTLGKWLKSMDLAANDSGVNSDKSGVKSDSVGVKSDDAVWTVHKWLKTVDMAKAVDEALEEEVPLTDSVG